MIKLDDDTRTLDVKHFTVIFKIKGQVVFHSELATIIGVIN